MEEHFDSKEEAIQAYRSLTKTETEILDRAIYESTEVSSMNVKELGLIYKQISFTAKLADRERYDIPIITKDSVMALHVQIVHSHEDRGSVEASMELEGYGELSIKLQVDGKNIKGFFIGRQPGKVTGNQRRSGKRVVPHGVPDRADEYRIPQGAAH